VSTHLHDHLIASCDWRAYLWPGLALHCTRITYTQVYSNDIPLRVEYQSHWFTPAPDNKSICETMSHQIHVTSRRCYIAVRTSLFCREWLQKSRISRFSLISAAKMSFWYLIKYAMIISWVSASDSSKKCLHGHFTKSVKIVTNCS